ncbi:MAG: DUF1549 and DUF1553 domain-containing protein [Pirellulaceae bacterium]
MRRRTCLLPVILPWLLGSVLPLATAQNTRQWTEASDLPPQVRQINRLVQEMWSAYEIEPTEPARDYEWCRRVYLDLLGRVPTVDELHAFTSDKSDNRYTDLVDQLLDDDEYTEDFARNWTTIWTNLLIGRTGGNNNRSRISRAGMQKYLRDSFARNKPYDRMVYELVTATGHSAPRGERFNGAVNFLIDKVNEENATLATAATSRIFMGLQVQCAQCHNHPFNKWEQQTYWDMNAFFRQTSANGNRRARADGVVPELIDQNFNGEGTAPDIERAALFFEQRNGVVKVSYPVFVDGTAIDPHGDKDRVNRRKELANLMLQSTWLDRAMVNRTWAHFMGYGFTKPVDDMGPHNVPSHPELLDYLASEFRNHDFDVRQLIRWIVLSRPYGLSSKIPKQKRSSDSLVDDPLAGTTPLFSRFYLRQMRAEELYESLLVASRADENLGSYEEREQRKNRWLQQFSQAFGTDEGDETTSFNGTIPQILMMFNGEMMRQATEGRDGGFLNRLANDPGTRPREKIHYLFQAGLSRRAKSDEMRMAEQIYNARQGNATEALRDIWWVILNSNEFIFNH